MIAQLLGIEIELILPKIPPKNANMRLWCNGHIDTKEGILGSRDYADKKLAEGGYVMLNHLPMTTTGKHITKKQPVRKYWNDTHGTVTHFCFGNGEPQEL
jgi:cysteine synthase B